MFQLLESLLEFLDKSPNSPSEQDLTNNRAFKDMEAQWPKLGKQLKLAWNGDARERGRGGHKGVDGENVYLFPKLLKTSNLQKYEPDFALTMNAKRAVTDLYKLFCDKFRIVNKRNANWLDA